MEENNNQLPQEPVEENSSVEQQNPYIQQSEPIEQTYSIENPQEIPPQAPYELNYYQEQSVPQGGKGLSIAALVFGIISIVSCCTVFLSIPCSIVAIILSIIAIKQKKNGKGLAIAGLICGIAGLVLTAVFVIYLIAVYGAIANQFGMSIPEFFQKLADGSISQEELNSAAQEIAKNAGK